MNKCTTNINLTQEVNFILPKDIQDVFSCYSLAAKNIRNKTTFCISNIQSAYVYNKDTFSYSFKDTLHINESNMISNANHVVSLLNNKIQEKYDLKLKEYEDAKLINPNDDKLKKPKLKLFKEFSQTIDINTYRQSIDKGFVENLIRFNENNDNNNDDDFQDYSIINSVLAQNVVQKVCDDFNHYFDALLAYFSNKEGFTAMPQKPSYKSKNELSSFEVSASRLNQNGSILTINKNHKLFFDFKKQKQLTDEKTIKAYNNFDFRTLIEEDIKAKNLCNKYSKELKVTLLRVVPLAFSKNKFKLQYTISFPVELKGFYQDIIKDNPDFMSAKDNSKYKIIKDFFKNKSKNGNVDKNKDNQSIPCFASMDLGHVNMAAIYYFEGLDNIGLKKADIISAKTFTNKIKKLDLKIDKQKQSFYKPNNEEDKKTLDVLSKIERNKEIKEFNDNLKSNPSFGVNPKQKENITREDKRLLVEHSKRIYEDKLIRELTYRKSNSTKDYLHKLSSQIVSNLVDKGIKLLIIGKNKNWKQEINIGSSNNRRAYNLPHSKLIELLKYKCLLKSILIIEQEESYTSKTSFACNEKLKEYRKKSETEGEKDQLNSVQSNTIRQGQKLYSKQDGKRKLICHADINGAMNIGRKVFPEFNIETINKALSNPEKKEQIKHIFGYRIVRLRNYSVNNNLFAEVKK